MKRRSKLWRIELVYLVNGREQIMVRKYRAPMQSIARSNALILKGAVKVNRIEEIK